MLLTYSIRIVIILQLLRNSTVLEKTIKKDGKPSRGISEEKLDELLWDLEIGLLESDVAYSVIESIKHDIKEEIKHLYDFKTLLEELK